jgi:hypothetical protein
MILETKKREPSGVVGESIYSTVLYGRSKGGRFSPFFEDFYHFFDET